MDASMKNKLTYWCLINMWKGLNKTKGRYYIMF